MRLLLDTHILLWYLTDDAKLPKKAKAMIDDAEQACYSIISLWEVAIKHSISVERMPVSDEELSVYADKTGFECLPLSKHHVAVLKTLRREPGTREHHDPFDRILLCQAKTENLMLLTHDALLQGYGEPCVLVV